MFTDLTIISEIARQRQSVLTTRSERNRAVRRSARLAAESRCCVVDMPAPRVHTAANPAPAVCLVA